MILLSFAAKYIVDKGGVPALVDYSTEAKGADRLPGIMCLGFIASYSGDLANRVIVAKGINPLNHALVSEPGTYCRVFMFFYVYFRGFSESCGCMVTWTGGETFPGPCEGAGGHGRSS
jgi:hypothetical protein